MKKILFTLAALAIGITAMAQTLTHVRITPKAGDAVLVSFESQPEISFLADGVKVTSADAASPITFQFDDIQSIDFTSETEVNSVEESALKIATFPDRVEFYNIPENSSLRVFSINGQLVYSENASGSATIYKSDFGHGVFVIAVGNNTFKVIF